MYICKYATIKEYEYLKARDIHISKHMLEKKIIDKEIMIIKNEDKILGWLRFNYFWDNTPFMNLLMVEEGYRGKGLGKQLAEYWEVKMTDLGYDMVMTSTLSDESAQHFYRKLEYKDAGSLILDNEALEIIFTKPLKSL